MCPVGGQPENPGQIRRPNIHVIGLGSATEDMQRSIKQFRIGTNKGSVFCSAPKSTTREPFGHTVGMQKDGRMVLRGSESVLKRPTVSNFLR